MNKSDLIKALTVSSYCLMNREHVLRHYTNVELTKILYFVNRGYDVDRYGELPRVPSAYIEVHEIVRDMTQYPFALDPYLDIDAMCRELQYVLRGNKNDYMYRTYAHKLSDSCRKLLYNLLLEGKDITEDMDYLSMSKEHCFSYLTALKLGYSKEDAYNILRFVSKACFEDILVIRDTGLDMKPVIVALDNRPHLQNEILLFILRCIQLGFNPNPYLNLVHIHNKSFINELAVMIHHTQGTWLPDESDPRNCLAQYLTHIGYTEEEINRHTTKYGYNKIRLTLLEMQKLIGISFESYEPFAHLMTKEMLKCIVAGEGMLTYLNLNTPETMTAIVEELCDESRHDLYSKFYFLKII